MNRYLILVLVLSLAGCAGKEEIVAYYEAVEAQNTRLMQEKTAIEVSRLQAFNNAIAAVSDSPIAVMALSMVFSQPQPDTRMVMEIDEPDTFVDGLKAIVPVLQTGVIAGFTAWGVSEVISGLSAGGTTYTLTDNASLDINSDNDGSFNNDSGDITTTNSGDGDHNGDEGGDETCSENPPAGFSPSGTPMWKVDCTCADHAAGTC